MTEKSYSREELLRLGYLELPGGRSEQEAEPDSYEDERRRLFVRKSLEGLVLRVRTIFAPYHECRVRVTRSGSTPEGNSDGALSDNWYFHALVLEAPPGSEELIGKEFVFYPKDII